MAPKAEKKPKAEKRVPGAGKEGGDKKAKKSVETLLDFGIVNSHFKLQHQFAQFHFNCVSSIPFRVNLSVDLQ
jgi:hypothetical protein